MMRILKAITVVSAAAFLCASPALAQSASTAPQDSPKLEKTMTSSQHSNADYNAFLKKYVVKQGPINLVRYGDVTETDKQLLDNYIDALAMSGPPSSSDEAIMAYWFNLYNAKTVSVILDNYPVKSIKDIGGGLFSSGPWKGKRLTVAGKDMSLDNIEHDTVRAAYDEPRVHYAFNCASIGCPNLKMSAWEAETLDADLTEAAKDYVNSPRGVSVDNKGRLTVSEIYKWYKGDFGGSEQGILDHVSQYAAGETAAALDGKVKINKFGYDWSLNDAK